MTSIVDVDNYKKKPSIESSIDDVLEEEGLFRLHRFSFTSGDCLFDTLQVLFYFRYTSIELRNGLIDHFLECLGKNNTEALESYQYELAPDFLYQLHGISNIETCICKMHLSTPTTNINPYSILFHDSNPSSDHYDPLLY